MVGYSVDEMLALSVGDIDPGLRGSPSSRQAARCACRKGPASTPNCNTAMAD
jgi:hypothetical protein